MKILTWNVNSIKTVRNYHPWSAMRNYKAVLDSLDVDIICFQETKLQRDRLEQQLALVDGYDAYFAFCQTKKGYSGIATYVRHSLQWKPQLAFDSLMKCVSHYGLQFDDSETNTESAVSYSDLDQEGRAVVTDHGAFILFNIYFPNDSGEERMPFKMAYSRWVQLIVDQLVVDKKRHVLLVGDVNVCHRPIDHCDPERSIRELGINRFEDYLPRRWFDRWLQPKGTMVDLFRHFHPDMKDVYTNWNTYINARPRNYGKV